MREIKFRAWHTTQNRMYSAEEMGKDQLTISTDGQGFINVHGSSTQLSTYLKSMIPMQCTGLKDKNGTEVYEGDIVKHNNRTFKIVFDDNIGICGECINDRVRSGEVWRDFSWFKRLEKYTEVIGNIYENPELLEKTNEN